MTQDLINCQLRSWKVLALVFEGVKFNIANKKYGSEPQVFGYNVENTRSMVMIVVVTETEQRTDQEDVDDSDET